MAERRGAVVGPEYRLMLAVIQARMSSTRLPGKVLAELQGRPMLARQIERVRRAALISRIVVATSDRAEDAAIAALCAAEGIGCYRGDLDDVLARFLGAVDANGAPEHVVRLTADCPLADPEVIDATIAHHLETGADYTNNTVGRTYPKGLDVEVMRVAALRQAAASPDPYDHEHVTPYLYRHPERYRLESVRRDPPLYIRWTVDTAQDLAFVRAVYADLYPANPAFTSDDVLGWQDEHPDRVLVSEER